MDKETQMAFENIDRVCSKLEQIEQDGFVYDDSERIEIAGSYPDAETAVKALHDDP